MPTALDVTLFDADDFSTSLKQSSTPLSVFRDSLKYANAVLEERFHAGRAATELVYARSNFIDVLMANAWTLFFEANDPDIALVAVGGYGRGELHPASDVDVLILLRNNHKDHQAAIEAFLTFLWDIGLEIGHSVRTLEECVTEAVKDITIVTNLQEARLLLGPLELFEEMRQLSGPDQIWPSRTFFAAKWEEQKQRHQKFHDTAYNLEPNIKEGPGGLRDIQMIGWVAKRHFGADTLHELVDHQFITEQEYQTLHEGQAFLWQIRFGLHILAKRREDRLLFDHQRTLAKQFGYRDSYKGLAVEQFMKQYYRTVVELRRLNEMLLQLFQEELLYADDPVEPVIINRRFQARKGFLEVAHKNTFKLHPFALLELFLVLEQHPELKGVRANTIRMVRDHRYLIDNNFRSDFGCRSLFMEIVRQPTGVSHIFQRMNLYGVLAAYLPVFGQIVGQMQHDLFHVYTVDEHTLTVIRNLRRFTVHKHRHEFPLCSAIIQIVPKQELLLLAGLFHDIAKGRGGDHSQLGAQDARQFCQDHGLSKYDTNIVVWLVENHLLMSLTAQRKDISDPEVVHEFAKKVGDKIHLNYLYLLTVADIRATSDSVWNSWKDALLKELYHATTQALRRGLENPLIQSEYIEENIRQARMILEQKILNTEEVDELWSRLGDEYFLRYSSNEIAWHTEAILNCDPSELPLILIREATRRGGSEVFIYTQFHSNLFAITTSVLEQMATTIMEARIFISKDGHTLDTFHVLDSSGEPISDQHRIDEIQSKLKQKLASPDSQAVDISRRLPRQAKHFKFPTEIFFDVDDSHQRTIITVKAYDRPGLLSRIGEALNKTQVRLQNAKIATYGERAEDIFFITDIENHPLSDPLCDTLKENIIELSAD